jgi:hypothetical protein
MPYKGEDCLDIQIHFCCIGEARSAKEAGIFVIFPSSVVVHWQSDLKIGTATAWAPQKGTQVLLHVAEVKK